MTTRSREVACGGLRKENRAAALEAGRLAVARAGTARRLTGRRQPWQWAKQVPRVARQQPRWPAPAARSGRDARPGRALTRSGLRCLTRRLTIARRGTPSRGRVASRTTHGTVRGAPDRPPAGSPGRGRARAGVPHAVEAVDESASLLMMADLPGPDAATRRPRAGSARWLIDSVRTGSHGFGLEQMRRVRQQVPA